MIETEKIAKQLAEICAYNDGLPVEKYDFMPLLEKWQTAKMYLRRNFLDDQLIYTYPKKVTFELTAEERKARLTTFMRCHEQSLTDAGIDFLFNNISTFFENKVNKECQAPDGKYIPKGAKIIKSLAHFIENKEILDKVQTKLSMILQEGSVSGTLCLSVHPLDFMSLSENNHNWRSCHALDGEYHTGNLSYMVDNCTIIAYLKSEDEVKLPHFPETVSWNNKVWRTLFFIPTSYNCIFAARQYPFFNRAILDLIGNILVSKMNSFDIHDCFFGKDKHSHWFPWTNNPINQINAPQAPDRIISLKDHYLIGTRLFSLTSIVKNNPNSLMYNDLLYSSVTKPWYTSYRYADTRPAIKIGGEIKCPICQSATLEAGEEGFVCPTCWDKYHSYISEDTTLSNILL